MTNNSSLINLEKNAKQIQKLAKVSPVLVVGVDVSIFGKSTIIRGDIPSKELGIVQTEKGLKVPSWFYGIKKGSASHQIIINNVDAVDKENQVKFYELLKYKAISNIELPKDCVIIVTAKNLGNVSQTILNLCQVIR